MGVAVVALMAAVIVAFFGLAITDRTSVRDSRPGLRTLAVVAWLVIVAVGWLGVAYLGLSAPGGLEGAWSRVQGESLIMRIAMWLFLLPWMGALRIWQTSWAESLRLASVVGLAVLTFGLSLRQLSSSTARGGAASPGTSSKGTE